MSESKDFSGTDKINRELVGCKDKSMTVNIQTGANKFTQDDERFMKLALSYAKSAARMGETPVGAVLVRDGEVISAAHNLRESEKNPLAHAEILCINEASRKLGGWRLFGCTLYVTLEPCPMCAGAVINSRIDRVVFGAEDDKSGSFGSVVNLSDYPYNHRPVVEGGLMKQESLSVLREFFAKLREQKKRNKG